MSRRKWRAVDSWAFVKGDAIPSVIEGVARDMRDRWPSARVRTFKRVVKAGCAAVEVTVIVAQMPREEVGT